MKSIYLEEVNSKPAFLRHYARSVQAERIHEINASFSLGRIKALSGVE